jgi:hypothetical protein
MRSGMVKVLFAATAIVASVTTGVTSASAQSAESAYAPTCTSNRLCVWTGSIFTGSRRDFYIPDNSCVNIAGPRYSAYNRQSVSLVLSEGTCGSGGRSWYIDPGEEQPYLLPNGARSAPRCSSCRPATGE